MFPSCLAALCGAVMFAVGANAARARAEIAPDAVEPDNTKARAFFDAAFTQRVALVGIGDSNQLFNANGWEYGWFDALRLRYGIWGTALVSGGEEFGFGNSVGTGACSQNAASSNSGSFMFTGAPPALNALLSATAPVSPAGYLYVPPEADFPDPATAHGMVLWGASGLDFTSALRFHFTHALFDQGRELHAFISEGNWGGPIVARSSFGTQAPPGAAAAPEPAPTTTDSIDLPSGSSSYWLRLWFGDERGRARGPLFLAYMQAENPNRTRGFAVHTLYGVGGASARDMAERLEQADDAQLSLFFSRVRAPLGPTPKVIVRINSGVNDRSEWYPSVTEGIMPGSSPEAFRDNVATMVRRIRGIWDLNHWDAAAELHFIVSVSHAISEPDDPLLVQYREVLRALVDRNTDVTAVRLDRLANRGEMARRAWYNAPWDVHHLATPGYEGLARRELEALTTKECAQPGDIDNNGTIDTADLVLLLADYGASAVTAGQAGDLDGDADCDTSDLILLLGLFGTGTCNAD